MREDARLDARAIGLAILAMAIVGTSYTAAKLALHDLPVFGTLLLVLLGAVGVAGGILIVSTES